MINADPQAWLIGPPGPALCSVGLPLPSLSWPFLALEGGSTYILILWSFTAPVPEFLWFSTWNSLLCGSGLTRLIGWIPFLWCFVWGLLFCPTWSSKLTPKSGLRRWLWRACCRGLENSVVSAFRSLNTVDEFPGKVRGSQKQSQPCLCLCCSRETMVLVFLSLVWFSKTHSFNYYQPVANWKQWDAYENLSLGLLWVTYSQKRQALIQLGLARQLPWKLRLTGHLHNAGSAKNWTDGFTRESPLSRKTQAPALALPNAQWPFCTHPTGRYPCLLCPWGCCKAPSRLTSAQRILMMTWWNIWGPGLQPGPILVSSGLANARTWIPGQGEDLELTSACGTSPIREGGCALIHHKTAFL